MGGLLQYCNVMAECRRSAQQYISGALNVSISAVVILLILTFLKEGYPEEMQRIVLGARKVMGWALIIGPITLLFYVMCHAGAFDRLINWFMKPTTCECGSTEFRLDVNENYPYYASLAYFFASTKISPESVSLWDSIPPRPHRCVKCDKLKFF